MIQLAEEMKMSEIKLVFTSKYFPDELGKGCDRQLTTTHITLNHYKTSELYMLAI